MHPNDLPIPLFKRGLCMSTWVRDWGQAAVSGGSWRTLRTALGCYLQLVFFICSTTNGACATFTTKNDKVHLSRTILLSPESHLCSLSGWCNCLPGCSVSCCKTSWCSFTSMCAPQGPAECSSLNPPPNRLPSIKYLLNAFVEWMN